MLVEINLLPKKEPRNIKLIVILSVALLLLLVAGFFLFWQGKGYDNQISSLENQISTTQQLTQIEQQKVIDDQVSGSVSILESAVSWASEDPLKTVPIIKHVTALLPQRGFIQNIAYTESGTVSMTVQFDTSKEAAYYLKTLLNSEWFKEVKLSSVTSNQPESTETAPPAESESTEAASPEDVSKEASTEEQAAQKKQAESETKLKHIVPRYIGQYQLTLNRDFINAEQNGKNAAASEGGTKQ